MEELHKPTEQPKINTNLLLLILGTLSAFGPLAIDMYLSSFSMLADHYHTNTGTISLSLSVYFFGLAGGQLLYGSLVDRYGRKPVLLLGISLFTLTSLIIPFSTSISMLLGMRFIQAIGSAAGVIIARTIIGDLYEERDAARFFSLIMIVTIIAPIIAPTLGAFLVDWADWQSIFYFLGLFGIVTLIATLIMLPETLAVKKRKPLGFSNITRTYRKLATKRNFILPALICAVSYGELFAFISGSPFVYMNLYGVGPKTYGLLFGINAIGMIVAAKVSHQLLKRFKVQQLLRAASIVNLVLCCGLLIFGNMFSLPLFVAVLLVTLSCVPIMSANSMAMAIKACKDEKGGGSAVIGLLQYGIAFLASGSISFFHSETIFTMIGVIAACSVLAFLSLLLCQSQKTV